MICEGLVSGIAPVKTGAFFCKSPKIKKGTRIEIQSRFKIQYPMKNRDKTNVDFP